MLAEDFQQYEMLKSEVAWRVFDRVNDIDRTFDTALDLGCGRGYLGQHIDDEMVNKLVQCELSEGLYFSTPTQTPKKTNLCVLFQRAAQAHRRIERRTRRDTDTHLHACLHAYV